MTGNPLNPTTLTDLSLTIVECVVYGTGSTGNSVSARDVERRFGHDRPLAGEPIGSDPTAHRVGVIAGGLAQLERDGMVYCKNRTLPSADRLYALTPAGQEAYDAADAALEEYLREPDGDEDGDS